MNIEIKGYAPGLVLQVSGVSDFFWSSLNCFFALLPSCLWLLVRLSNQLVDYFVRGVYTYEKDAMQELKEQRFNEMMHGAPDAMQGNKERQDWANI